MNPARAPQPRQRRYSARHQARLDAETHAKLEELANTFHQKCAAIVRYAMQWGIRHSEGWTIAPSNPASVSLVHVLVEPALMAQVQEAAAGHGASVAAWVRCALRQVTLEDFPASWRTGETAPRSHESGYYHRPFMLRLNDETSAKLATLAQTLHRSAAEVIRQLIAQATPEVFPESWHMAAQERRAREAQSSDDGRSERDIP
jgi:predicted transcriptional regulator